MYGEMVKRSIMDDYQTREKTMNKETKTNDKRKIAIALICFGGALLFFITSIISYKYGNKEPVNTSAPTEVKANADKLNETDTKKSPTPEPKKDAVVDNKTFEQMKKDADSEPLDPNEGQDSTYAKEFKVTEFQEELLPFINNDLKGMKNNIQETLYANGYYGYSSAEFKNYSELDYAANTISLTFLVNANVNVTVSAVYDRDLKSWYTRIW